MREAVLVAFLRRASHQPAFVVMGPGSRPGRRIVVDALARPNPMDSIFKQPNHVIATRWLAMTLRHGFAISPHAFFARGILLSRPPNRGRRECRALDAPDSRVCNGRVERTRVSRVHRNHPAFPTQWF